MSNPTNLAAETAKVADNGTGDTKLLQNADRAAFQSISGAYVQAEIEALRDALITAGIMKAS